MTGTIENRSIKEVYISDYDGENQRRVTVGRTLNIAPRWSPDARSIAYYVVPPGRRGRSSSRISSRERSKRSRRVPAAARTGCRPGLPTACGSRSRRRGTVTQEIYVANRDGSNLRRLTNNPGIDITPTLVAVGYADRVYVQIARGSPQIYIVSADGVGAPSKVTSESYCDKPTWSPAPYNEISYASRNGPGYDIKIVDLATRHVTALTFGEGTNESPGYSPNGRHIVFTSTRAGKTQVFTMARGRQERAADHEGRQQLRARLVKMTGESTMTVRPIGMIFAVLALAAAVACHKNKPPVARPLPPPPPPTP